MRFVLSSVILAACMHHTALADQPDDGIAWLQKIAAASRQLNYTGTFVYQRGNHTEVSRLSHFVDASGEYEKLEVLDGPPREIIRTNDTVQCFFPLDKTVKIEKRNSIRFFPFLLPQQSTQLSEHYQIDKAEQERISGFLSQALVLKPRDAMRYGHKFWADISSGLLLKTRKLTEANELLDQYTFTELVIGGKFDRALLKPRYDGQGWRHDHSGSSDILTGWVVNEVPPGFRKVKEMARSVRGKPGPISHIVYSDGLAAVSIFIEPLPTNTPISPGATQEGPVNVYTKFQGENLITVIGEVPAATVALIGGSVSYKGK